MSKYQSYSLKYLYPKTISGWWNVNHIHPYVRIHYEMHP